MNSYATVNDLTGSAVLNIVGTANHARYRQLLESVSREVDKFTHREFYTVQETRYFSGHGGTTVLWGDYSHIGSGSLKEDSNGDGTFDLAWAGSGSGTTDWYASPYDSQPTARGRAAPYTRIEVNRNSNGSQDVFEKGQRNYQVDGVWGYSNVTVSIGAISASFDATATTLTTDSSMEIGWTIQSGTERMYIEAIGTAGTTINVIRGINGYDAAVIASGSALTRVEYPGPIVEAVIMQAGRLAGRAKGGYTQEMGLPEAGEVIPIIANGLDNDVRQMIGPFRKLMVG